MAQRTVTILSDDLDGKEGRDIATVTFGYDGWAPRSTFRRRIAPPFQKALSPYIDAARKTTSTARRSAKKSSPRATPEDREWLRSNGFPNVKDRGRLPGEAIEALENGDSSAFRRGLMAPESIARRWSPSCIL